MKTSLCLARHFVAVLALTFSLGSLTTHASAGSALLKQEVLADAFSNYLSGDHDFSLNVDNIEVCAYVANTISRYSGRSVKYMARTSTDEDYSRLYTLTPLYSMYAGAPSKTEAAMCMDTVDSMVSMACEYESVVDQLKFVNDYICENTEYDLSTAGGSGNRAYGSLIYGRAVCEGYALAAKLVFDELDIPNILHYASSSIGAASHVWNEVYIDGEWKHIDITWNDSADSYDFFLTDDPDPVYDISDEYALELMRDAELSA